MQSLGCPHKGKYNHFRNVKGAPTTAINFWQALIFRHDTGRGRVLKLLEIFFSAHQLGSHMGS